MRRRLICIATILYRESFIPLASNGRRITLSFGRKVSLADSLCAEKDIPFARKGDSVDFTLPGVLSYETVALYSA